LTEITREQQKTTATILVKFSRVHRDIDGRNVTLPLVYETGGAGVMPQIGLMACELLPVTPRCANVAA
jgi:hypothetical protein